MNVKTRKWLLYAALFAVLAFLLLWAFRKAPFAEIWAAIRQMQWWEILVILALNGLFYVVATLRWWVILRADNKKVPYLPLLGVRLSVFGVSYFTLGPQVGGEPLQVLALQRRYGLTDTHATATVLMDKLLEFMVDFFMLAIGLTAILRVGVLAETRLQFSGDLLLLAFLIFWPPIHLILLYKRHYPLSGLVHRLPFINKKNQANPVFARRRAAGQPLLPAPPSPPADRHWILPAGRGRHAPGLRPDDHLS
jgi:uncharacterized protein (TIRG00374 family)